MRNGTSSGIVGASPTAMPRTLFHTGMPSGAVPQSLLGPVHEGGSPAALKESVARMKQRVPVSGGQSDEHDVEDEVMLEDDDEGADEDGTALKSMKHEGVSASRQQTPFGGCTAVATTPQSKGPRPASLQTTPTSHQQSAGLARLHSLLSPAAMQKILQAEEAQAAQTPEAKRRAEMRRAVQLLPHAHELVRIIFGLQGPTVKPLTQVAQAMCERSTQRQGLTAREASNTLVALARAVPEFLRIEDPRIMADGSARPRSVVINRTGNINAVAAKLKQLASDPDAAISAIFERGSGAVLDVGSRGDSPGCGVTAVPPSSPLPGLRPRALAQSLENEAGDVAATELGCCGVAVASYSGRSNGAAAACGAELGVPPPTPSSRRRPPGLPLAPASPMLARGGQTPTRSSAFARTDRKLGTSGSILAAQVQVGPGPLPAPSGAGFSRATSSASGADDFLRKLCRAGAAAGDGNAAGPLAVKCSGHSGGEAASCGRVELGGKAEQESSGRPVAAGSRTPGRTVVQEEVLNSIRRSSAKRTCRKLLDDELEVGDGSGNKAEPLRRRLEESLVD
ncbi:hypothetical protein Vafri_1162 [Volvox africanus]|nr:hypothetical protein Vafri_1162 [Volvox africanus]